MNKSSHPPARPSATIVVAREGQSAAEILLVRRRAGDAFGDSYAFPGGIVDHDESGAHIFCAGRSAEEADAILDIADGLDYYSAAIRELFEETGILLARDLAGNWAADEPDMGQLREDVDKGKLRWADFLRQKNLCMAADVLHYFAYWETPYVRPKRWQTRFFIAALPPGQTATHDGSEVTDIRWLTAADALSLGKLGQLPMPYPTTMNLRNLVGMNTVAELVAWAETQPALGIEKIRPVEKRIDGKAYVLIPGDEGYDGVDSL
jgi:8-oxo-dGTP pyrophosphatase MutT (NUDIX family)